MATVSAENIARKLGETRSREQKLREALRQNQFLTETQRSQFFGQLDSLFQGSKRPGIGSINKTADTIEQEMGAIQQTVEQRQKAISASLEAQRQNVNPRLNSREKIAATYFGATNQPKSGGASSFVSVFAQPLTAAQQGMSRK